MTDKTHLYYTFKVKFEGVLKDYKFDRYTNDNFPKINTGCIYVFSNFKRYSEPQHNHIDHTSNFSEVFPAKDANKYLYQFDSDSVLIYESINWGEMDILVDEIKRQFDIPDKYVKINL